MPLAAMIETSALISSHQSTMRTQSQELGALQPTCTLKAIGCSAKSPVSLPVVQATLLLSRTMAADEPLIAKFGQPRWVVRF